MNCIKIRIADTTEGWRSQRRHGIGGSDIAAIMGASPWLTRRQLWRAKLAGEDQPETFRMKIGRAMEQTVADLFTEETGLKVRRSGYMYLDTEHPEFLANVDRLVVGHNAILECKTTSSFNAGAWADGAVPEDYYMQVQWYLGVTRAETAYICCLIGNSDFANVQIAPDAGLIADMKKAAWEFWRDYVVPARAPEAEAGDLEDLRDQDRDAEPVELPEDTAGICEARAEAKRLQDQLGKDIKAMDAKILDALGAHEEGHAGRWKITCRQETRTTVDTATLRREFPDAYEACQKQSQSFPLRIKEGK